ncbi:PRC-barrel domain-containing protein [Amaricoccus sp.]|uniref:PRC-barrel domain-containing protein n=1 Tax=Amaricoccus sp. TaxID=1872485 RepID=UPI00262E3AAC|nr:PRC-barrel domain-containing protein [uncultured Amaricoccus sp.]
MKKLIVTTALGALLATGAYAESATDHSADAPAAVQPLGGEPAPAGMGWDLNEGQARVDVTTVSADALIGARVETLSGEKVADVKDVILSDDGKVENIAAGFGGFLGFGTDEVLLTLDEVDFVTDINDTLIVRTNLTPEALQGRPVYEGS